MTTDATLGAPLYLDRTARDRANGLRYIGCYTGTAGNATSGNPILIRTGAETMRLDFNIVVMGCMTVDYANAVGQYQLLENQSQYTTGSGTPVILYNQIRPSTNTTLTKVYTMVADNAFSGVTFGTTIKKGYANDNGIIDREEFRLKHSTTYCIDFASAAGANTTNYSVTIYLTKDLGSY